jgi:hypothetical protein
VAVSSLPSYKHVISPVLPEFQVTIKWMA